MAKTKRPSFFKYPVKKNDVPVTQSMLFIVRDELRDEMQALRTELKGDMQALRTELKGDMQALRTELKGEMQAFRTELKSEMQSFKSEIKSEVHQIKLLIEEQNSRNIFVLDGLRILFDRQDRIEKAARA